MSSKIYEQLFLVNNIPQIAGIFQVRDMIKSFVYTGEWYMNKAKEFAKRFKLVNETIRRAYSRNNPISIYMNQVYLYHQNINKQQEWKFGFNSNNDDNVEHLQLNSANCYVCGEYIEEYSLVRTNLSYCTCQHNQEDFDILLETNEEINNWTQEEYQQYWDDYWYYYDLDTSNSFMDEE
jgi:hypothetical protein